MENSILFKNARIVTMMGLIPSGWLLLEGKTITRIGTGIAPEFPTAQVVDAQNNTLLPGFIDLHVHGAVGYECMDASRESLEHMAQFYAQHGVTSFLATTWTASRVQIWDALNQIAACQGQINNGASLLGAHLEGPYLNPVRCGAQDSSQIRRADREEALGFLDLNVIRLLALAPEFAENQWLVTECVRRGITVSAAHTAASYEDMEQAVELGLTQTTHTFNAMTALNHRLPGTVGAAMDFSSLNCELIADNVHVHPAVMRILLAAKGIDRIILISDAVRGAGLPPGSTYQQDGRTISVTQDRVNLPDGTLAGSSLTMDRALANFKHASRRPLEEIWQVSSLNAARAIHISHQKGSIEVGKDADLVLVDENINVQLTIAEGRIVYQKEK